MENTMFHDTQKFEINRGLASGVDVGLYRKTEYGAAQMRQIRLGLEWNKAHPKGEIDVETYMDQEYDWLRMELIRAGMTEGLDVRPYAMTRFNACQMWEILEGLRGNIDVSLYADNSYSAEQMQQIRLGLVLGIEAEKYADFELSAWEMEQARRQLEGEQIKRREQARQRKKTSLPHRIWAAIMNKEKEEHGRTGY